MIFCTCWKYAADLLYINVTFIDPHYFTSLSNYNCFSRLQAHKRESTEATSMCDALTPKV